MTILSNSVWNTLRLTEGFSTTIVMKLLLIMFITVTLTVDTAFSRDFFTFDCQNIKTEIEDLTCSNHELMRLSIKMAKIYSKKYTNIKNINEKEKFKNTQKKWVLSQNEADYIKLGAYTRRVFYLKEMYLMRIGELNSF